MIEGFTAADVGAPVGGEAVAFASGRDKTGGEEDARDGLVVYQ